MSANRELRWHPLLQQWTVVAANSAARPWSGAVVTPQKRVVPEFDPACYLCPGVARADGQTNPSGHGPWAFDNDFPSLVLTAPEPESSCDDDPLHKHQAAIGICRVMCWSENHSATLASLSDKELRAVVELWKIEFMQLSQLQQISQVLIFENKGTEIGVSNLHPHGQVYATGFVTDNAQRMRWAQHEYRCNNDGRFLLQDLIQRDEYEESLLVDKSTHFKTIVPFAARVPFETWIVPVRHVSTIDQLTAYELDDLSRMYHRQVKRYDSYFQRSTPNVTLLHNAPCDGDVTNDDWCFHVAMQPPLRDATTLKYMAGFEIGSNNVVNPVQPESAAAALRAGVLPGQNPGQAKLAGGEVAAWIDTDV